MTIHQFVAFAILAFVASFAIPVFAIAHKIAPTNRWVAIHFISAFVIVISALVIYFSK